MQTYWRVQQWATEDNKSSRVSLLCWKAGTAESTSRLGVDLIYVHTSLKGRCREDGDRLFSVVPNDNTRRNQNKWEHRRVHLNTRKHFDIVWVTEYWHRGCPERWQSLILGETQKLSGHGPGWLAEGSPAWAGGNRVDGLQMSLPTSIVLWFQEPHCYHLLTAVLLSHFPSHSENSLTIISCFAVRKQLQETLWSYEKPDVK